ncbi:MAG: ROK family glucokinase [Bacillus sp. (in: Bacteria)]|nr:ROK family glucokinase [Bacillus sp. (in: firmicutes)]
MDKKWLVGVDIGGTTIKMAFIGDDKQIISKWEIDTDTAEKGNNIPFHIAEAIEGKLAELKATKEKLKGIGVGAPGPVNYSDGSIKLAVNLGWENFPLKEILSEASGLQVVVDNDANIAAIGEMWAGAGEGAKDLILATLGTGVGGGIIANGEIVRGTNGAGGEIGHITSVVEGGYRCNCGKTGCLETVASATGIVRMAVEKLKVENGNSVLSGPFSEHGTVTAKAVFDAAKDQDELAVTIVREVAFHLGFALGNLANGLNPEKIVIGGGVSRAGDVLLHPVKEEFARFAFPRVLEGAEFTIATLGNDAGVIGGAYLAKTKLN